MCNRHAEVAKAGDARAWSDAAWSMRNQHRLEEAVTWLREAVEAGRTSALYPAA